MTIRKFAYSLAVVMVSYASNRDIFYPRNSVSINRRGYSGCGGWEKIVGELKAKLGLGAKPATPPTPLLRSAKSIAPCRMHL